MARARGEIHWLWRLLLIPLFALYVQLFDEFDFLWHMTTVRLVDYAWNFVFLGACIAGLILLMAASPSRKSLFALGAMLLLTPELLECSYGMSESGMMVSQIQFDVIAFAIRLTCALWGLLLLRGPKKREWEKAVLWLFMMMRTVGLYLWKGSGYLDLWPQEIRIFAISVMIGAAADGVYRGLCLADVLTPILTGAWFLAAGILPTMDTKVVLYIEITLCLVYATVLICSKPAKNMYTGFILTLLGMISYAAVYLLNGYI